MNSTDQHIQLINISKSYPDFQLKNINISVKKGEYFVLLGHSGAGKSMLFEIIAGLKSPDSGEIIVNGKDITQLKINKRKIGVVFQDYAIFPHKKVRENIAFPLYRKFKKKEIQAKVESLAEKLNISHLLEKYPDELSGGETQRCVLARTLASEPDVLLLDEPLSALDVQLKSEIRQVLKEINSQGLTIIHITHDYREAIGLAHKIAVIDNGEIIQQGKPTAIFNHPKNKFTAAFAGIPNFYEARISAGKLDSKTQEVELKDSKVKFWVSTKSSNVVGYVLIRNEDITLSLTKQDSSSRNNIEGVVTTIFPAPNGTEVFIDIGVIITALVTEKSVERLELKPKSQIWVSFKASAVKFIETGKVG